MKKRNTRSAMRVLSILCMVIFALSFMTVESHRSNFHPWFKYPGFLEADSEIALAGDYTVSTDVSLVANRYFLPGPVPFVSRTTLFLNVYRAPPSLES